MKILNSIGAVIAGFITVVILSIGTDTILHKTGLMPDGPMISNSWLLIALIYRTVYTFVGGYVTASLAPSSPMKHAMVLLAIGVIMGSLGAIVNRDLGPGWYSWGIVVFSIPAIWFAARTVKPKPAEITQL